MRLAKLTLKTHFLFNLAMYNGMNMIVEMEESL